MKQFDATDAGSLDSPLEAELRDLTRRRGILTVAPPPLPTHTRIIAVSNQKGGVGKTTTTVNMAAALARFGARVLVVDLDPQGNATTALGFNHHEQRNGMYHVLMGESSLTEVRLESPDFPGLFCVPSSLHLAGIEVNIAMEEDRNHRLHAALATHVMEADGGYHYIFIDCPPSLGILTVNALVAAHEVFVPIQCEYYALEGLTQLQETIRLMTQMLNPTLRIQTILLTMFDSRTRLSQDVAAEVHRAFGPIVLQTFIPRTVRIAEAPSYNQTIISFDPTSLGAVSYLEAAYEFASRNAAQQEAH